MTRDEFIAGYLTRSGIADSVVVGGESILWGGGFVMYALACGCGEDGCDGWAMVPEECRWFHTFQNQDDDGDLTFTEATDRDMETMDRIEASRAATP